MAALVRQGIKSRDVLGLMGCEKDQIMFPQKGDLSIVLDGNGNPVLVIEPLVLSLFRSMKFLSNSPFEEGEGNRTLGYWRMAHENYFRRSHFENRAFDETMPVV